MHRRRCEQSPTKATSRGEPEPDPEPPAAPPIIILSENSNAHTAPHAQPHPVTSYQDTCTTSRYNLRVRKESLPIVRGEPESPDPFPAAPPVIILSNKRPASASPPRSPPSVQTTISVAPSTTSSPDTAPSASPTTHKAQPSVIQTPALDHPSTAPVDSHFTQPLASEATSIYHKHTMGSKASKLAPSHGKLQPSQDKQDKAEMKEPSNYYTHRSKSMRRKAGKTGATSAAGGAGGGAGGVGGAV